MQREERGKPGSDHGICARAAVPLTTYGTTYGRCPVLFQRSPGSSEVHRLVSNLQGELHRPLQDLSINQSSNSPRQQRAQATSGHHSVPSSGSSIIHLWVASRDTLHHHFFVKFVFKSSCSFSISDFQRQLIPFFNYVDEERFWSVLKRGM